jgi:hypothetical protein
VSGASEACCRCAPHPGGRSRRGLRCEEARERVVLRSTRAATAPRDGRPTPYCRGYAAGRFVSERTARRSVAGPGSGQPRSVEECQQLLRRASGSTTNGAAGRSPSCRCSDSGLSSRPHELSDDGRVTSQNPLITITLPAQRQIPGKCDDTPWHISRRSNVKRANACLERLPLATNPLQFGVRSSRTTVVTMPRIQQLDLDHYPPSTNVRTAANPGAPGADVAM